MAPRDLPIAEESPNPRSAPSPRRSPVKHSPHPQQISSDDEEEIVVQELVEERVRVRRVPVVQGPRVEVGPLAGKEKAKPVEKAEKDEEGTDEKPSPSRSPYPLSSS
jgi:hypothetical protein